MIAEPKAQPSCPVAGEIEPGDRARILRHITGPRHYPDIRYEHPAAGEVHVVESMPPKRWGSFCSDATANLRYLNAHGGHSWHFVHPSNLELVEKGLGSYVPGVSLPFSADELRHQRWETYVERLRVALNEEHRTGYSGFVNPATFLAALAIDNDSTALHYAHSKRRRDGSLNPCWALQAFKMTRFKIDAWALDPLVEVPGEFASYVLPTELRRDVSWSSVAEHLHA